VLGKPHLPHLTRTPCIHIVSVASMVPRYIVSIRIEGAREAMILIEEYPGEAVQLQVVVCLTCLSWLTISILTRGLPRETGGTPQIPLLPVMCPGEVGSPPMRP
jgi:hypothetical protein